MRNKTVMPKLAAPVERNSPATGAGAGAAGIMASTHCDIETKQCFPFAGDDAE